MKKLWYSSAAVHFNERTTSSAASSAPQKSRQRGENTEGWSDGFHLARGIDGEIISPTQEPARHNLEFLAGSALLFHNSFFLLARRRLAGPETIRQPTNPMMMTPSSTTIKYGNQERCP